jgi:hypothetical protein
MNSPESVHGASVLFYCAALFFALAGVQLWSGKAWSKNQPYLIERSKNPGLFWACIIMWLVCGAVLFGFWIAALM